MKEEDKGSTVCRDARREEVREMEGRGEESGEPHALGNWLHVSQAHLRVAPTA